MLYFYVTGFDLTACRLIVKNSQGVLLLFFIRSVDFLSIRVGKFHKTFIFLNCS